MASAEAPRRHPDRERAFELGARASVPDVGTLAQLLAYWAEACPQRVCAYFVDIDNDVSSLSYRALRTAASRWAAALAGHGVSPGQRVVLALPTGPELLSAFFACQWLGVSPCIAEAPALGKGLAVWCERAAPKLALIEPSLLVTEPGLSDPAREGLVLAGSPQRVIATSTLDAEHALQHSLESDAPAILQFTSGTTSRPKAVACAQRAVLANLRAIGGDVRQFHEGDLMVGWLPLFHDMGLVATTLAAFAHGIPVALMAPAAFVLRPARWLWAVHMFRGSLSFAPNFAFRLCLRRLPEGHAELNGLDLSSWRGAFNAAEFIHAETAQRFSERFAAHGLPANAIAPAYGMAEMTVGVSSRPFGAPLRVDTISRAQLARARTAGASETGGPDNFEVVSLGRVFEAHQLEVHDAQGAPLPERCEGELVLRGPSLFDGYFRDPEATRETLRDGWLRTGDLGYLADGEVYITGRRKDVIIRGGENHHPHVLEEAAGLVAGVRAGRVAAVGLSDRTLGTEAVALLVETGETSQEQLERMRREIESAVLRISGLRPDHVLLVGPNTVPVTTSGKIRRASARLTILNKLADGAAAPAP